MPNWKKLIVSGSDAELNSLNVTSTFTASGLNYPAADGISGQFLKTNGDGTLEFDYLINTSIAVKNVSGGTILKGTPCYITASGVVGNVAGIVPADAGNSSLMPAGIIAGETLNNGDEGLGLLDGFINGVNTSDFAAGDTVYVGVGGGYTNVRPTGSALIQKLGNVEKVDASNGSGVINGPAYYNEVPNITSGYAWVGNSDQVATAVATSSFVVDNANTASYVAATNIDGTVDISDQTNLAGGTNLTLSGDTMNLDANISLTSITASSDITTAGSLITTKTGSVTDPALLIGVNSGYLSGNNVGIILEEVVPGTTVFVPYFVSDGAKVFGFGSVMQMEKNVDMQSNKLYFDGDSTNTYIASNADDPEDLEIHAEQDIILGPINGSVIVDSEISASGAITGSDVYINDWGSVSASLASAGGGGAVATYTNGSNNRIITSTGTDGINGEANLTFDGSTLALNGNISSSGTSDNFFGGRIVLDNSKYIAGTETGGQTRNILSIDGSNVTQVANGNLETNIKGTSISIANDLTVTGKVTADFIDMGEGTLSSAGDFGFGSTVFNRLGTLASTTAGKVYYLNGSWAETDADSASTSTQLLAVAVSTTSNNGMLVQGIIKMGTNTGFSGATTGDPLYLSTTSGQVTDTAPSGTGDIVRIVGYVVDAADGVIYFNPSQDWIEL